MRVPSGGEWVFAFSLPPSVPSRWKTWPSTPVVSIDGKLPVEEWEEKAGQEKANFSRSQSGASGEESPARRLAGRLFFHINIDKQNHKLVSGWCSGLMS